MQTYVVNDNMFPFLGKNTDRIVLSGIDELIYYPATRKVYSGGQEVTPADGEYWDLIKEVLEWINNSEQSPVVQRELQPFRDYFGIQSRTSEELKFVVPKFPFRLKKEGVLRDFYKAGVVVWGDNKYYGSKTTKGPRGGHACQHIKKDMRQFTRGAQEKIPPERRKEIKVLSPSELVLRMPDDSHRFYRDMLDYLALTHTFDF